MGCYAPRTSRWQAGGRQPGHSEPDSSNALRFLARAARGHVELNVLSLAQWLVARALDVGVVDEDVVAAVTADESEALLGVEELHSAGSQCISLLMYRSPS